MVTVVFRSFILYLFVTLVMRLMGKRQVGELQPFELVVAMLIADLAAVPMEDTDVPLLYGLIPLCVLLVAELSVSTLSLHSHWFRRLMAGTPSIVIENGRIVEKQLRRLRFNINDLLEQLRLAGYPNIQDVEYAILETSGTLSVIPKSQKRPVNPADLNLDTSYEGLPYTLIVDGRVNDSSLQKLNLDRSWLDQQLRQQGFGHPRQVLFASIDTNGTVYIQGKETA